MRTIFRVSALFASAMMLMALPATALAAGGCASQAAAVDEYCETLPGAGGPYGTAGGHGDGRAIPLWTVLPSRFDRRLAREPATRTLLTLPVGYRHTPLSAGSTASTDSNAVLEPWLVALAAAIAVALAAALLARHRRRAGPACADR